MLRLLVLSAQLVVSTSGEATAPDVFLEFPALTSSTSQGAAPAATPSATPTATPSPTASAPKPTPDERVDRPTLSPQDVSGDTLAMDDLGSVPLRRGYAGVLLLAPSVADGGELGDSHPSISGGTGLENRWLMNGLDIGVSGVGAFGPFSELGSLGWTIPYEWLEEVRVIDSAAGPELAATGGGTVAFVLRRGGDRIETGAYGFSSPAALRSSEKDFSTFTRSRFTGDRVDSEAGIFATGPIGDRMRFFVATNPAQSATEYFAPPGRPLAALGGEIVRRDHLAYAARLDVDLARDHALEAFAIGDNGRAPFGPQDFDVLLDDDQLRYSRARFVGGAQAIRFRGGPAISKIDVSLVHASTTVSRTYSAPGETEYFYSDVRARQLGMSTQTSFGGGIGFHEPARGAEAVRLRAGLDHAFGSHRVTWGLALDDERWSIARNRSGAPGVTFRDPQGNVQTMTTGVTYQLRYADDLQTEVYRVTRGDYSRPMRTMSARAFAVHAEERWALPFGITVSGGVRIEQQEIRGSGPDAGRLSTDFEDGISPRIGVTHDLTRDGRFVTFAHLSRDALRIAPNVATALSTSRGIARVDYFSEDFRFENQIPEGQVPVAGSTTHVLAVESQAMAVDRNLKPPLQDELALGGRYTSRQVRMGARLVHRRLHRIVEDYTIVPADDLASGAANFGEYRLGNPDSQLPCTDVFPNCWRNPTRSHTAIVLDASRRGEIWTAGVSYRWSQLRGNYEGWFESDLGNANPSLHPDFDFPNATPLMIGQGRPGLLPLDRTHLIKLHAGATTRLGLELGASVITKSGRPRSLLNIHPAYEAGGVPQGRRGTEGRDPSVTTLDAHLGYRAKIGRASLRVMIDVFNLLDAKTKTRTLDFAESAPGVSNPDYRKPIAYQEAREVRLGVMVGF